MLWLMTTNEIKAKLATIRNLAAAHGVSVSVSRSRRGVPPTVAISPDWQVFSIDEALAHLRPLACGNCGGGLVRQQYEDGCDLECPVCCVKIAGPFQSAYEMPRFLHIDGSIS